MEEYICQINGKKFESLRGMLNHLRTFGMTSKDYYDKYHKSNYEGICYCGKPTKFSNFKYNKYCCDVCALKSEEHKVAVKDRFKNNPKALESFKASRIGVDINISKRRATIEAKAKSLGFQNVSEYYSEHGTKGALKISKQRKIEATLKAMETKSKTGNVGGRSYYKPYVLNEQAVMVQGYEPIVLDYLKTILSEDEILVGKSKVPTIKYGEGRLYFPDIYIPRANLLIEVKSTYTYERNKDEVHLKCEASLKSGHNIFLLVLHGNKVRKYGLEGYKNLLDWAISSQAPKPTWYGEGSTTISSESREQVLSKHGHPQVGCDIV